MGEAGEEQWLEGEEEERLRHDAEPCRGGEGGAETLSGGHSRRKDALIR